MVLLIRRGKHLAFVDVVHPQGFEHLRLREVTDARFGHHRDRDRMHDFLDDSDGRHARYAAFLADVRRHPLKRHDCHGARVLGNLGLLGRGDVHDHAALQHFGQSDLQLHRLIVFPHI